VGIILYTGPTLSRVPLPSPEIPRHFSFSWKKKRTGARDGGRREDQQGNWQEKPLFLLYSYPAATLVDRCVILTKPMVFDSFLFF
jgi:hypothetical protein